jgi:hypothetical protein
MINNRYALAVEIEDSLFEIFEVLHFEKDTELDIRYKNAILKGAVAVSTQIRSGIKIGAIFDGNNIISENLEGSNSFDENYNVYFLISDNKIFGVIGNPKTEAYDKKYQAAFENNVIVIDISLEKNVGFGDLWDGQKIIKAV